MYTRQLINYLFYISLEKWKILRVLRWYENHMFLFLIIDLNVSLNLKMFFSTIYACSSEHCV